MPSIFSRSVLHLAVCAAIVSTAAAGNLRDSQRETKPQPGQEARALAKKLCDYRNQNLVSMPTTGLGSCDILNVGTNQLASLGVGDLESLPRLKFARFRDNQISSIAPDALGKGCPQLQEMYLHFNSLTAIGANDFSQLSRVRKLHMQENQISSIAPTAFSGVGSLVGGIQSLDVSDNALTSIASGDFVGGHNLRRLILDSNAITGIDAAVINTMPKLKYLNLRDNLISAIPSGLFAAGDRITTLDLGVNGLTSIGATYFSGLSTLKTLDLAYNPISAISPFAFDVMPELRNLNLEGVDQATPCAEANAFCYVIHTSTDMCFCPPACTA